MRKKQANPTKCYKRYRRYSAESMLQAYEAVKLKGLSVHRASVQFRVPEQTLRDRVKGIVDANDLHLGSEQVFTTEEEQTLVDHVQTMSLLGYGLTNVKLQQLGGELAHKLGKRPSSKSLSNNWLYGFINRWNTKIASRKPSALDTNRAKSSTPETVDTYFENLKEIMDRYQLHDKPQFIYNVDETGIQPEHRPPNIIAAVGTKPQSITSPRSTTTTVIGCVNAIGASIPPFYIFKGKRFNPDLMEGATPGSVGVMSDSGWSNGDIFQRYLREHFLQNVHRTDENQPILLLCDGHASHISSDLIDWAKSHNVIIIFVLPAHTSHLLQPLDVGVFGPFKNYYYSECATFMRDNIGQKVTKYNMVKLASTAYTKATTPTNIISSFRKTGIYPLAGDAVPKEKLFPSECFKDDQPVQKVTAMISGKEAIEKFLIERAEKQLARPCCNCNCSIVKSNPVSTKPKPGGQAITEPKYINEMSVHEKAKQTTKSSKRKATDTSTVTVTSPRPSTSGILSKKQHTNSDADHDEMVVDDESDYDESDNCCVCKRSSPPNLNKRPYLKIVTWAKCDTCVHWVHLSFCTPQVVIRRGDTFLCQHCVQ